MFSHPIELIQIASDFAVTRRFPFSVPRQGRFA
jgi:hypothetical protein